MSSNGNDSDKDIKYDSLQKEDEADEEILVNDSPKEDDKEDEQEEKESIIKKGDNEDEDEDEGEKKEKKDKKKKKKKKKRKTSKGEEEEEEKEDKEDEGKKDDKEDDKKDKKKKEENKDKEKKKKMKKKKKNPLANTAQTELDLDSIEGLSEAEAARRLAEDGPNELQRQKPRTFFEIVFDVVREPMFVLLLICVVLCFVLKDYAEGGMLSAFVFFIIGITIFQERKTERALDALKGLSAPRATVFRGGKRVVVPGRDVVRGDVVLLAEGDRVPADMALMWAMNMAADESLLTGEAVPVRKSASEDPEGEAIGAPGGDDLPYVFSGSMVVSGKAIGLVRATGAGTNLGQIGKSLGELKEEKTPLERETNRLVLLMAGVGCAVSACVFLYYGLKRHEWTEGALAAITLAMGLLPEEFPVVLAVFFSLGAWRISKSNVLTRRNSAIESLGACTVLCTDKTGTLTMNQMMVAALWDQATGHRYVFRDPADAEERVDEECHEVVEYAILSSQRDPFDPMEMALWRLAEQQQVDPSHTHSTWEMVKEYPLTRELLATSRVYRRDSSSSSSSSLSSASSLSASLSASGVVGAAGAAGARTPTPTPSSLTSYVVAVKGAFEAVADLCHMEAAAAAAGQRVAQEFAGMGLRVLGVARCEHPLGDGSAASLPPIQHDYPFEFVGLVAFADPIRPTVPAAIAQAYGAGIKVAMITGDYPATARAIAERIGLEPRDRVVTGPEMDEMDDAQLSAAVAGTAIFARVVPEQKLRIVQAYKARGEIVAMTGDGVNDAPALKAAHIGVAMGMRGTDVAREAAKLVLLDDDFSSIVRAVRLGRRIYDNLQKAMAYIISIHVPLAGVILIPVLLGWEPIFRAVHIVFLEMVIDPACSVILEAEGEEPDVMERPPRDTRKSMVSIPTALLAIMQGLTILAGAILIFHYVQEFTPLNIDESAYAYAYYTYSSSSSSYSYSYSSSSLADKLLADAEDYRMRQARSVAFGMVIVANLCLILEDRSWELWLGRVLLRPNRPMWIVCAIVVPALFLVLFTPGVTTLFAFKRMEPICILLFIGAGIVTTMWFEAYKAIRVAVLRRRRKAHSLRTAANGSVELEAAENTRSTHAESSAKIDISDDQ